MIAISLEALKQAPVGGDQRPVEEEIRVLAPLRMQLSSPVGPGASSSGGGRLGGGL